MSKNVLVVKHFESPPEEGSWWRLMCLTGQSKGEAYLLKGQRVVMGRSDKADIRVNDIKSSREHAELTRSGDEWVLTDLGSQNGIMLNDEKIQQVKLKEGDKFVIGQTVYKFHRVEAKRPVAKRVPSVGGDDPFNASPPAEKKKGNALLWLVIVVAIAVLLLEQDPPAPSRSTAKGPTGDPTRDVTEEYLQLVRRKQLQDDKALKQKMNTIFQRGLREYREKNYFRAINEFNLALILNPNDPLADFYLRKTKEELDLVIADHFIKAKRDDEALRYRSAMVAYCAVLRLLHDYPNDDRYKAAENNLKELEGKMGLEPGENSCSKKQSAAQ